MLFSRGTFGLNEQIVAVAKKEQKAETTKIIACSFASSPPDRSSIFLSSLRKKTVADSTKRPYPKK